MPTSSGEQRPMAPLSWFEARDFCIKRGARLPTEAEWEYAARGPDGWTYPWGNAFKEENIVSVTNSPIQTANVGSKPAGASWVGALDMAGNLAEWTNSLYKPYPYTAEDGREADTGPRTDVLRVFRGGSLYLAPYSDLLRSTHRSFVSPANLADDIGVRCARSG